MTKPPAAIDLDFTILAINTCRRNTVLTSYLRPFSLEDIGQDLASYTKWLKENGFNRSPAYLYRDPHQIYLGRERTTSKLVGISGIVPDYHQIAKQEELNKKDFYFFGFFAGDLVLPDYREYGIDTLMIQHRINVMKQYSTLTRLPAAVYTLVANPASINAWENFGFKNQGSHLFIKEIDKEAWLLRLQIDPSNRSRTTGL